MAIHGTKHQGSTLGTELSLPDELLAALKNHPADPDLIEAADDSTKDRDRVRTLITEWNSRVQRA